MKKIIRTDSSNIDFRSLINLLDQDLQIRDGDEHSFYAQFNKVDSIRHVIVVYEDGAPAGCGAIKEFSGDTAEVKRMFVHPDFRRQGIAKMILSSLEEWAAELNYTACILETGKKQPEAISLYQARDYHVVPNYGQYEGVENSVCMKKQLH